MSKACWEPIRRLISSFESEDFADGSVPIEARRHPLTMGLLWVTMCTGFANVMAGFEWYKSGFTLSQVLLTSVLSMFILMAYAIPACAVGSQSGLTWASLARRIFGHWGSYLVSFNLVWVNIGWYTLLAMLCGEALQGLFHWHLSAWQLGLIFCFLMAFNNYFGFAGIANFARYLAAPLLIGWVGIAFFKALYACPASALSMPAHQGFAFTLTAVSNMAIGFCIWGNEPDYWRFSRPSSRFAFLPLLCSFIVGGFVFPLTGWMMAHFSGVSEYGQAAALMNTFAFGGISWLAALVLWVVFVAGNDANLYGSINAMHNMIGGKRRHIVLALTAVCMFSVFFLIQMRNAFEAIASLTGIFLASVTVIMVGEWFLLRRLSPPGADYLAHDGHAHVPAVRWPAVVALLVGCFAGVITSGVIPGTESLHFGICSVHAWIVALVVYIFLRLVEIWQPEPGYKPVFDSALVVEGERDRQTS